MNTPKPTKICAAPRSSDQWGHFGAECRAAHGHHRHFGVVSAQPVNGTAPDTFAWLSSGVSVVPIGSAEVPFIRVVSVTAIGAGELPAPVNTRLI